MRLSPGYGAVDPATPGTERQFPQDGAVSVLEVTRGRNNAAGKYENDVSDRLR
jgi:hypothetical protein